MNIIPHQTLKKWVLGLRDVKQVELDRSCWLPSLGACFRKNKFALRTECPFKSGRNPTQPVSPKLLFYQGVFGMGGLLVGWSIGVHAKSRQKHRKPRAWPETGILTLYT